MATVVVVAKAESPPACVKPFKKEVGAGMAVWDHCDKGVWSRNLGKRRLKMMSVRFGSTPRHEGFVESDAYGAHKFDVPYNKDPQSHPAT